MTAWPCGIRLSVLRSVFLVLPLVLLGIATPGLALPANAQQGSITGSVVDGAGASIAGARVTLANREALSGPNGEFEFSGLNAGTLQLSIAAGGFASKTITAELAEGQSLLLPAVALAIDTFTTSIDVTQTQAEIAQVQIKAAEQQRLLGVVPNFFAEYDHDAVPLNTSQKFELTAKSWADPWAFVSSGVAAGIGHARNYRQGFGQGAQGYGKRYGASLLDHGTTLLLKKVVAPTIFKQDPRYFYRGTGTTSSRALYAVSRTLICRGDNRKDQFCYSNLVGRFGAGFITNYYYPPSSRERPGVILQNTGIGLGIEAAGFLFEEFIALKLTHKKR